MSADPTAAVPAPEPETCPRCGVWLIDHDPCPVTVWCPHCVAEPGDRCVKPSGDPMPVGSHARRRIAVMREVAAARIDAYEATRPIHDCPRCDCRQVQDYGCVEDGFGSRWAKCSHLKCGLEVVRPGKVQCWCDDPEGVPYDEQDWS